MGYELKQELKLTQNLVMTPQLQLAIKLLQLSRLELVELVREEVQTNPVLEDSVDAEGDVEIRDEAPKEPEKPEIDWQAYIEEQSEFRVSGVDFNEREDDDFVGNISASTGKDLKEHLLWQLKMYGLSGEEAGIGEFLIGNIEEDGYLRVIDKTGLNDDEAEKKTVDEIVKLTGADRDKIEKVLSIIQQFDPLGAGSRNLRECLLIQARSLLVRDTVVEDIIQEHLEKVARKNFKGVAKALGVSVEDVYEAVRTINKYLNPAPGAGFGSEESRAIVPDIFILKVGDEYVISLNEDGMPKLKISPYYRELMKANGAVSDQAKGYIQEKLRSAVWLIKSVHQRQRTIYRVVECIVKFQREFLDKGLKYLKPLVLKDVAEQIGVHESTVSRVTSSKYVQTPRGIFELKYFFSTGMSKDDGSDVAVEYIKEKVRSIIKSEDAKHPLSDMRIVELLKESGIVVARRTATKYREALGFQSSSRRKVHY